MTTMLDLDRFGGPLETVRVADDTVEWSVWSTTARLVVTDPAALPEAYERARECLRDVDAAASRFRDDSELVRLDEAGGAPVAVSWLLKDLLTVALDAARFTDGDVDPTLGNGMRDIGYDRDFSRLATGPAAIRLPFASVSPATGRIAVDRRASWRDIVLTDETVTVPAELRLDLGATAKAFTSDLIARVVADELDSGVLVSLGGDIATAGPGPDSGWRILVSDGPGEPECAIALPAGSAVASSSTIRRRWAHDGAQMHHIIDPHTGRPAEPVWRTVTVAASSCVMANTLTTAAIVRGAAAKPWLGTQSLPARLVAQDGSVSVLGGWPADAARV
ncbi:MAG TPA: FAD:protein FMN transferase [Jatrophihabitans sp.]|jgi:thiamine biosynthesis lipoprotein|uniref:FAD:protein FMN transferase n=1 Tax=Jatrophihabitans sp. TaxID=1932789 RepID=UPI002E04A18A|nr:FAD:protein FMN transferase [Jatrophihabitans sp.]